MFAVTQAAEARSDTPAILTGKIIGHRRDEYYSFMDDTGTITVEIPRVTFRRCQMTPVRLTGGVGRGLSGRYIDLDRLEVLEQGQQADPAHPQL